MALLRCWIDEHGLASLGEVGPSDHQGELGERRGENQPGTYIDPEFVVSSPVGTEDAIRLREQRFFIIDCANNNVGNREQ